MNSEVSKKISYSGILVALAMIFSYVEAMIPINFGIPGMKLGIANLVIVTGLYMLKPKEVLVISLIRIFLMGIMFGNGISLAYSVVGGIISFFVMLVLKYIDRLSVIGISIAGGVAHNIGQIIVAVLIVENTKMFYYIPTLMIAGGVTGAFIGILSDRILKVIKNVAKEVTDI
jgi:heptaprenyl diphosphate synthase